MKTPYTLRLTLISVCLVALTAPSCSPTRQTTSDPTPVQETSVKQSNTDDAMKIELGRFETLALNPSRLLISAMSPEEGVEEALSKLSLLPESESEETAIRTSSKILLDDPDSTLVLYTLLGGGDDSVAGIRYRVAMSKEGSTWSVSGVGRQVQCWKGRGHEAWSDTPCK